MAVKRGTVVGLCVQGERICHSSWRWQEGHFKAPAMNQFGISAARWEGSLVAQWLWWNCSPFFILLYKSTQSVIQAMESQKPEPNKWTTWEQQGLEFLTPLEPPVIM